VALVKSSDETIYYRNDPLRVLEFDVIERFMGRLTMK
jgi:hypothetical protein